jgi:hypothetical protein
MSMASLVSGRVLTAFFVGAAGGWAVSHFWSAAGGGGFRPAAKEAIKAGLTAFERGSEMVAEFSESVSDLVAEAEAERKNGSGGAVEEVVALAEEGVTSAAK